MKIANPYQVNLFPSLTKPTTRQIKVKDIKIDPDKLTILDKEIILDALQRVANLCDGASSNDGNGFNKNDTDFGKSLASNVTLSARQAAAGCRMVWKYRRQLPESTQSLLADIISTSKQDKGVRGFKIIPEFCGGKCVIVNVVNTETWKETIAFNPASWSKELEQNLLEIGLKSVDILEIVGIVNIEGSQRNG